MYNFNYKIGLGELMAIVNMFNINFNNYDFNDLSVFIDNRINDKKSSYIVTCNVDHIMKLQKDSDFYKVYQEADLVIADGMPIIWASKILGKPLKEKVSGSDIIPFLSNHFAQKQYKLFFLGAAPGIAQKAAENLINQHPGMKIVGTYSPSYGFENNQEEIREIIEMIKTVKPDILFVGVGAPKQEKWIHKYYKELNVPVSIGVGASLDFMAGNINRAPVIMQKTGLEWLWRLMQEPTRLWKRYLIDDSKFLTLVIKEYFQNKSRL